MRQNGIAFRFCGPAFRFPFYGLFSDRKAKGLQGEMQFAITLGRSDLSKLLNDADFRQRKVFPEIEMTYDDGRFRPASLFYVRDQRNAFEFSVPHYPLCYLRLHLRFVQKFHRSHHPSR